MNCGFIRNSGLSLGFGTSGRLWLVTLQSESFRGMSFTWAFGGGDSGKTPRGFWSFGLWLEVSALFVSLRVLPGFGAARSSQGMPVTGTNLTDTKTTLPHSPRCIHRKPPNSRGPWRCDHFFGSGLKTWCSDGFAAAAVRCGLYLGEARCARVSTAADHVGDMRTLMQATFMPLTVLPCVPALTGGQVWQLRDDQLVSPEWGCKLRLLPTRNFLWGLAQGSKFRKVFLSLLQPGKS